MVTLFDYSGLKVPLDIHHYPDGTLKLNVPNLTKWPYTINWQYENDEELFLIATLKDFLTGITESDVELFLPYVPNARMDRVKTECFTLKTFCNIINYLNFSKVYVVDPHSDVTPALLNNSISIIPRSLYLINDNLPDNMILYFPDNGAMKRYNGIFNKPYVVGFKNHNWETGKIESYNIINSEKVKDKDVIVIDDICSRGKTFISAAEALKSAGARDLYLYITHAEKAMYEGDILKTYKQVITTNSLPHNKTTDDGKVKVIELYAP